MKNALRSDLDLLWRAFLDKRNEVDKLRNLLARAIPVAERAIADSDAACSDQAAAQSLITDACKALGIDKP